jgi:predicted amidohydrolase
MERNLNAIEVYMIQMRVYAGLENKERNLERACKMIDTAMMGKKVDIVALPEVFATGFPSLFPVDWEALHEWAEYIPDDPGASLDKSPILKVVAEKTKEHQVFIQAGSIIEKGSDGKIYNAACMIDDQGRYLGKYRKVQPWEPEPGGGDSFPVFKTEVGNIGCDICYDGNFPEISRMLALNGAELIFRPSEWNDPFSSEGFDWWKIANCARAIENHCYDHSFFDSFPLVSLSLGCFLRP